jgi:hypothetical protein
MHVSSAYVHELLRDMLYVPALFLVHKATLIQALVRHLPPELAKQIQLPSKIKAKKASAQ